MKAITIPKSKAKNIQKEINATKDLKYANRSDFYSLKPSCNKYLIKKYPVITITRARQSGKTYLAKNTLQDYKYIKIEDLEVRGFAKEDPKEAFKKDPGKIIIDEIQKVPELTSYLLQLTSSVRSIVEVA